MTIDDQVKAIRLVMIQDNDRIDTCGHCGLTGIFTYTYQGYGLCPECDHEAIENYKKRGV